MGWQSIVFKSQICFLDKIGKLNFLCNARISVCFLPFT